MGGHQLPRRLQTGHQVSATIIPDTKRVPACMTSWRPPRPACACSPRRSALWRMQLLRAPDHAWTFISRMRAARRELELDDSAHRGASYAGVKAATTNDGLKA